MSENSSQTDLLLQGAAQGDSEQWGTLLARHRERLRRMVALRLDRRLQGRIDASDVIQADVLLSCDDRLCRLGKRHRRKLRVTVANPLDWLEEHDDASDA